MTDGVEWKEKGEITLELWTEDPCGYCKNNGNCYCSDSDDEEIIIIRKKGSGEKGSDDDEAEPTGKKGCDCRGPDCLDSRNCLVKPRWSGETEEPAWFQTGRKVITDAKYSAVPSRKSYPLLT